MTAIIIHITESTVDNIWQVCSIKEKYRLIRYLFQCDGNGNKDLLNLKLLFQKLGLFVLLLSISVIGRILLIRETGSGR